MAIKTKRQAEPAWSKRGTASKAKALHQAALRKAKKRTASKRAVAGRGIAAAKPTKAAALATNRSVAPASSTHEIGEAAKVVRAQKGLVRLAELRLIHRAMKARASQDSIAALLGTSQSTVSRIAKQIEQTPSMLDSSPAEVINQREVGQVDTATMMKSLLSFDYDAGGYDPTGGDGFVRGCWRQIEDALVSGLITDEEYERLARAVTAAKGVRATR